MYKFHRLLPVSAVVVAFATTATNAVADQVVKIGHVGPLTRRA
jgi:branched-chain amino acid transport system substrate-binding protein